LASRLQVLRRKWGKQARLESWQIETVRETQGLIQRFSSGSSPPFVSPIRHD
jgi:hypothetical protein